MPELCLLPPQGGVFFSEQDHRYFWRGQTEVEVPSSSHIIDLGGGKDFDKDPWQGSLMRKGLSESGAHYFMERVRDIRAAIGTEVHGHIQTYLIYGVEPTRSSESEKIFSSWLKHVYPRIGKIYIIEQPMIHVGGVYGFTPDLIAEVDGVLTGCDWKSNQMESFAERYQRLVDYAPEDEILRGICDHLARVDAAAGRTREKTARVRSGWQMQQGSYAMGVEAVRGGLRVQRGINFMLSVDGVAEHQWNRADLDQGWLQFANGLLLHHQRAARAGTHPVYCMALDALYPLMRP
jgi:hypothetical protein